MKKITESQLKDKVSSLREYLKVYEAEAAVANPWEGKDPAKAAAWAKLSPMVQQKIGMADPTDSIIVGRMAKGEFGGIFGGGASDANPDGTAKVNQAASVTPAAPSAQELTAAASASGEAVGKSLQRFKELLAMAATPAAAPAAPAAAQNSGSSYTGSVGNATNNPAPAQSPYALSANGARLNANESVNHFLNKLRLIESRQLNEALTPELEKELDTLAQSYGDSEDPEIAGLMKQYSDYKNSKLNTPNQAAAVTPAAPAAPEAPEVPAGPINRDSMTFGQAFADARKKGEKQFNWRGKPYAVKLAPPKPKTPADPTVKVKGALPNNMSYDQYQQAINRGEEDPAQAASALPAGMTQADVDQAQNRNEPAAPAAPVQAKASKSPAKSAPKVTAESVGYNELQRIVSLVNHR